MKRFEKIEDLLKGLENVKIFSLDKAKQISFFPTGSLSLDKALSFGLPEGVILDIFGEPMSGKSLLSASIVASLQKKGKKCLIADAERGYYRSTEWLEKLGCDASKLLILHSVSGEEYFEAVYRLLEKKEVDVVVFDSVPSLVPKDLLDKEFTEEEKIACLAKLMSKALAKLTPLVDENKSIIIFVNQMRASMSGFGLQTTDQPTGGKALSFYSSIRLKTSIVKGSVWEENKIPRGHIMKVFVVKNKVAPPFREGFIFVNYEKGIERDKELLHLLVSDEIIKEKDNLYILPTGEEVKKREIPFVIRERWKEFLHFIPNIDYEFYEAHPPESLEEKYKRKSITPMTKHKGLES